MEEWGDIGLAPMKSPLEGEVELGKKASRSRALGSRNGRRRNYVCLNYGGTDGGVDLGRSSR